MPRGFYLFFRRLPPIAALRPVAFAVLSAPPPPGRAPGGFLMLIGIQKSWVASNDRAAGLCPDVPRETRDSSGPFSSSARAGPCIGNASGRQAFLPPLAGPIIRIGADNRRVALGASPSPSRRVHMSRMPRIAASSAPHSPFHSSCARVPRRTWRATSNLTTCPRCVGVDTHRLRWWASVPARRPPACSPMAEPSACSLQNGMAERRAHRALATIVALGDIISWHSAPGARVSSDKQPLIDKSDGYRHPEVAVRPAEWPHVPRGTGVFLPAFQAHPGAAS